MLLSLQFVLESSFVAQYLSHNICDTGDTG
jgi:hypothetical protein